MHLFVSPGGVVRCLYGESLDLASLGAVSIERASHVEPTAAGAWTADLGPIGGPMLGPFSSRSAALAAEQAWLERLLADG